MNTEGGPVKGSYLRFYVHEKDRVHGRPTWEWLLEQANQLGIRGGSAFKAMAGFGRHHHLHEARFFELAGSLAVEVEFIVDDDEAVGFIGVLKRENVRLFYARIPATFSVINPDAQD